MFDSIYLALFKIIETLEKGQSRVPSVLSRDTKGGVRGTKSRQPIEEERRTANQVSSGSMCVHSFSRVWRNKGRSGSPRSFARHSEKAGSQPKKSRYCAPPYRRLPVFGQSLLNSRRSPPSGTTPSLRRLDVESRCQRGYAADHARAFLMRDITYRADSRHARR